MKVSIIGGGGRVGSNAAYALQCRGAVSEIALVDADADQARGEALDIHHGASVTADQRIEATDAAGATDSDIVCITAGSRRRPDESRLALINRNVSIFRSILDELRSGGLRRDAILFVVSNPVDVLTRLAREHLDWPPARVVGLGTVLDTARFRSLIAAAHDLPPTQVDALILGEHGDTMTPIWSSATAAGVPLVKMLSIQEQNRLFQRTKGSGAEVLQSKGGAGYAVGQTITEVINAIAMDRRRILPVTTPMAGEYGLRGTCLSVPTVVGRSGVEKRLTPELWPKEVQGIQNSARALEETWQQIE